MWRLPNKHNQRKSQKMKHQYQPVKEENKIINTYIDNDPLLRNLRSNLLNWNAHHRAGIGPTAAGEIIYCIGRLIAKKAPQK